MFINKKIDYEQLSVELNLYSPYVNLSNQDIKTMLNHLKALHTHTHTHAHTHTHTHTH